MPLSFLKPVWEAITLPKEWRIKKLKRLKVNKKPLKRFKMRKIKIFKNNFCLFKENIYLPGVESTLAVDGSYDPEKSKYFCQMLDNSGNTWALDLGKVKTNKNYIINEFKKSIVAGCDRSQY